MAKLEEHSAPSINPTEGATRRTSGTSSGLRTPDSGLRTFSALSTQHPAPVESSTDAKRRVPIRRNDRTSRHDRTRENAELGGDPPEEAFDETFDEFAERDSQETHRKGRRVRAEGVSKEAKPNTPPDAEGIVLGVRGRYVTMNAGGERIDAFRPADLQPVAGDIVTVRKRSDGTLWAEDILPRRTSLSRPDPHKGNDRLVMAANIDIAIHVSAVVNPPLRLPLVDRFLVAIRYGGTDPLLCVNKMDLADEELRDIVHEEMAVYEQCHIPVIYCSAKSGEGLDALRDAIRGKTCALAGHSGVGKSSVIKAMSPDALVKVGDLQERGKGRHTTSMSMMYDLGEETRVIDTPGIREFGLWDIDRTELRWYFEEFHEIATKCRFADCSHLHEPGCAVKAAAKEGTIPEERYDAYVALVQRS